MSAFRTAVAAKSLFLTGRRKKGVRTKTCPKCKGEAVFVRYCAAYICGCGNHLGLARCYCGWSASGADGRKELREMGENLEEDY